MRKYFVIVILLVASSLGSAAQPRKITFKTEGLTDSTLYIAQHFRDSYIVVDSATANGNQYTFSGSKLERGIYALLAQNRTKQFTDFVVDGSQKFTIACNQQFDASVMKVSGCKANSQMFAYIAKQMEARNRATEINERRRSADPEVKLKAEKDYAALSAEMENYEKQTLKTNANQYFFRLITMFAEPDVPDTIDNKLYYYLNHYWDNVDMTYHSLTLTPNLYNKMNYYFFGVLYNADFDTIKKYADTILTRVQHDSVMLRYFLDHIMPRYYRSTKNIGWDAEWCHLVRRYYLAGLCPWATPGDLTSKQRQAEYLEKSLIGAYGAELVMADTTQSDDPANWISSHRFPERYVILWFWDPDCHHCQEQTATLKTLYDSLQKAPDRRFEVYAVGYESDVEKWKRYVRNHHLPFVNVGGTHVNIDYQEAYNVHGAPTMIILNADRQIIMNKVLPTKSILPFLNDYEKRHPEQANRPLSRWQQLGLRIKQQENN